MNKFAAAGFVLLLGAGPAWAQAAPGRTIDMTTPLHGLDGPLKDPRNQDVKDDPKCEKCPVMTLGHLVASALFNVQNRDERTGQVTDRADVLWARGILADKIKDDPAATLTAEQVADIKALIAKGYPLPVVIAQVWPLLDPSAKPKE